MAEILRFVLYPTPCMTIARQGDHLGGAAPPRPPAGGGGRGCRAEGAGQALGEL
jgi:hypothetical protein